MPRKTLQDRMRPALRVHRLGQAPVEALDRNGDRPHTPPRVVAGSPRILAQELQDLLPLPPRLRLHWLDGQLIIQHGFKLALLPAQVPDSLGIVQPQVPLLDKLRFPGAWPFIFRALSASATA